MNTLERLREAHHRRCNTVNVAGVEVTLAPMNASDGIAMQRQFADMQGLTADNPLLLAFYVELIARSAVEPGTAAKALDSDEGRELLAGLPMLEQIQLGVAAAEVNAFIRRADAPPTAKKNSPKKRSSRTASAEPLA